MKNLPSIFEVLTLALLCGCGGGAKLFNPPSNPPSNSPLPLAMNIAGNWQLNTTSSVQREALEIAGSINQSASALSAALHVDSPLRTCFDPLTTMTLSGAVNGSKISLVSTSFGGQVATFTGTVANDTFTGTYAVHGGCADGDQGNVTGMRVPLIPNQWSGTFTGSGGQNFSLAAQLAESTASPQGSFGVTGTASFTKSCFGSGTVAPGNYPSGSFVLGTRVALEIKTDSGTVNFLGTDNPVTGEITGDYTISGSSCDHSGTAVLVGSSPWNY